MSEHLRRPQRYCKPHRQAAEARIEPIDQQDAPTTRQIVMNVMKRFGVAFIRLFGENHPADQTDSVQPNGLEGPADRSRHRHQSRFHRHDPQ